MGSIAAAFDRNAGARPAVSVRAQSWLFLVLAVAILAIVVIAFTPTLYQRQRSAPPTRRLRGIVGSKVRSLVGHDPDGHVHTQRIALPSKGVEVVLVVAFPLPAV